MSMTPEQLVEKLQDFGRFATLTSVVVLIVLLFTILETSQAKIRESEQTINFEDFEFLQGMDAVQRKFDEKIKTIEDLEGKLYRIYEQIEILHGIHFPYNGDRPHEQMIEDIAQKLDKHFGDHTKWKQEAE